VISYQLNSNRQNKLFTQTKRETTDFLFSLFLSIVLVIADARYHCMSPVREIFSFVSSPLHYISDFPARFFTWGETLWMSKQELIRDNNRLNLNQLFLNEKLQHMQGLWHENEKLKALLALSEVTERKAVAARVLSLDTNHAKHILIINKGKRDHLFIGQPVLDQHGVMGQVIEVGLMTSSVLLISDSLSAVPVKNNRTGERGILSGTNNLNQLILLHIPKTSSVMTTDLLVTSGLGGRYPEGYPVGRVIEVLNQPGDDFINVSVAPLAMLNRSQLVLLIWPNEHHSILSKQLDDLHDLRNSL
jgi:rod shape-determining protein MreC